jgi:hypothetical protein
VFTCSPYIDNGIAGDALLASSGVSMRVPAIDFAEALIKRDGRVCRVVGDGRATPNVAITPSPRNLTIEPA